jgi:hypothetical protein
MKKERVMNLGLKKHTILRMLRKLNPDADFEDLDWDSMDNDQTFPESYRDMATGNPEYVWGEESLEEIEQKENDIKIQNLLDQGVDEETIDRIRDEMDMQTLKGGWKRGWIAGKETYIKTVPIKPHTKDKAQGRIQTTCNREFIGLEAKITIVKPEEPNKESMEWEPDEYE